MGMAREAGSGPGIDGEAADRRRDEEGSRVRVAVATRGVAISLAGLVAALVWLSGDPPTERVLETPGRDADSQSPGNITSLAFASGGRTIASTTSEGVVRFWDAAEGRATSTIAWAGVARVVASPDGRTLAVRDGGPAVTLLDAGSGGFIRALAPGGGGMTPAVRAVAFSPDGRTLAASYKDGSIRVWDMQAARADAIAHEGGPTPLPLAYSPDGRTLAAGHADGTIRLRDPRTGLERATARAHGLQVLAIAYAPDGRTLASGGLPDPATRLWDAAALHPAGTLEGRWTTVSCLAYSPDGRALAAVGGRGAIRVWDATTGRLRWRSRGPGHWALGLAFSPDGRTLATAGGDEAITLRKIADLRVARAGP